jgi:hypothetical protein
VNRCARRDPDQEPLAQGGLAGGVEGRIVVDADHLVDHRAVEDLGDEAGADPLDPVRRGGAPG